jgi:flagellar basal body rod protein FlgG
MPFGKSFHTLSKTSNEFVNQATIGFKRRDAEFTSIVGSANSATSCSSGGVQLMTRRMVDKVDKTTDSSVDFAISADGMFIVNTLENVNKEIELAQNSIFDAKLLAEILKGDYSFSNFSKIFKIPIGCHHSEQQVSTTVIIVTIDDDTINMLGQDKLEEANL